MTDFGWIHSRVSKDVTTVTSFENNVIKRNTCISEDGRNVTKSRKVKFALLVIHRYIFALFSVIHEHEIHSVTPIVCLDIYSFGSLETQLFSPGA
jgi:hypothetical protein